MIVPQLPASLIEPCIGLSVDHAVTVQDMAKVSIEQEAVILSCEEKRKALVKIVTSDK